MLKGMKGIMLNKYLLIGSGVCVAVVALGAVSAAYGLDFTGMFKAFDVSLSPGEYYERNITVRKFYNTSVRFQKEGSTSYLTFDNNETVVVLRDADGVEILNVVGVDNGKVYEVLTNYELASVASVSAQTVGSDGEYEDVVLQPVNDTVLSTSGAKAYITVKVHYGPAVATGFVVDDLTGEAVGDVDVAAYENDADPAIADAVNQNVTGADGAYYMSFDLISTQSFDVYVDGYDVV